MNLMYAIMSADESKIKNKKISSKLKKLKDTLKESKLKVNDKCIKRGDTFYYENCLPLINKDRDVLTKPSDICKIMVNWKNKKFAGLTTDEIVKELKTQYAWSTTIVDSDHTRNKFKNKEIYWVVFDTEELAKKAMRIFNSLFMTAIEIDCIEEYKKFKENPEKRPLTFDKLVSNAYDLYEMVDNNEL